MGEFRHIGGRTYAYAGLFPAKFAKEYARKHRKGGWYVRLEKVKNPVIKGKKHRIGYKIWLGGTK